MTLKEAFKTIARSQVEGCMEMLEEMIATMISEGSSPDEVGDARDGALVYEMVSSSAQETLLEDFDEALVEVITEMEKEGKLFDSSVNENK